MSGLTSPLRLLCGSCGHLPDCCQTLVLGSASGNPNLGALVASVLGSETQKLSTSPEAKESRPNLPLSVKKENWRKKMTFFFFRSLLHKEDKRNEQHNIFYHHRIITNWAPTVRPAWPTAIWVIKKKNENVLMTQISGEENQYSWCGNEQWWRTDSGAHVLYSHPQVFVGKIRAQGKAVTCSSWRSPNPTLVWPRIGQQGLLPWYRGLWLARRGFWQ